jgi:murein DD-endopeptidase MepM/ murein hydrolase activator NlpD
MSNRVSGGACRNILAFMALVAVSGSLAGCSSLSNTGFGSKFADPTITGSTAGAAAGNLAQNMPQSLPQSTPSRGMASSGRYLPPADIGAQRAPARNDRMTTASVGNVSQPLPKVITQDLPSLNSSSPVGSTQTMPQQVPFKAAANPIPAAVRAAPKLNAVPKSGYTHVIESGESLYAIARKYKVTTDSIVHANGLGSPDKIIVGQKLTIPGVTGLPQQGAPKLDTVKTASVTPKSTSKPTPVMAEEPKTVAKAKPVETAPKTAPAALDSKFRWPVSGKVVTDFAASRGTGINIDVPEGTTVRASETGTVIYVGSAVEGYGNLILVRHDNGYVSAYAHLSQMNVSKGDTVSRGDAIGASGMTGAVSRPQLHFELRKGATPVDPMPLLAS